MDSPKKRKNNYTQAVLYKTGYLTISLGMDNMGFEMGFQWGLNTSPELARTALLLALNSQVH